jgi:hypothetical protein
MRRREQFVEHVLAARRAFAPPPRRDVGEQVVVQIAELPERREPPRSPQPLDRDDRHVHQGVSLPSMRQERLDLALESVHVRSRGQAHGRAEDDPQRDPPHHQQGGGRRVARPRPRGFERLEAHRVEEGPHPLALQGRDQDTALPRVRRPVEHQDRAAPDGRGEQLVGLARVEHVRVAAEHLADRLRVGQHHEGAGAGGVDRERVAEAAMALVEQSERVAGEPDELPPGRGPRPRRERGRRRGRRGYRL